MSLGVIILDKELLKYNEMKKHSETIVLIGGVSALIGGALLITLSYMQAFMVIGVIFLVGGMIAAIVGFSKFSSVSSKFKNNYLKDSMHEWIENGRYEPKYGLSESQVYQSEFMQRGDRFHSEDMITGTIDGVGFVTSDVKTQERRTRHTNNGTQTYYVTLFMGQMYIFDFNKTFDGALQVLENARPVSRRNYGKVNLESMAFNKKFTTYSTNDHSAFYVLTPHFMEALLRIETNHPGKIAFSFIGSKMYMGINNNKDSFKIHMFRQIDETLINSFKEDLKIIYELVDDLKLNKNIFKEDQ